MSTLIYNNWVNFISGAPLQAFEAVILQSPLLTNLLNAFGGAISLSSSGTYFDPTSGTIYIGTGYALASTQDGFTKLAVALAHELGHAEVTGGNPAAGVTASSVSAGIQIGLDGESVAAATEFVVASQLAQARVSTIPEMAQYSAQVISAMAADLNSAGGAQAFVAADSLNGSGYLTSATETAGGYYIVPDGTPLIVEATVSNEDIGYLKVGQPVEVKVDTFPFQRYGSLKGTLISISPDAEDKNAASRDTDTRAGVGSQQSDPSRDPANSSPNAGLAIRVLVPIMPVLFAFSCLYGETALCADAPSPPSQKAIIQEVVRVANKYIDHGPCEPTRAEPSTVATMSPYTPDVEAARATAMYVAIWSGDIGCRGGSGTETMNYLVVEKRGVTSARIVGVGELDGASVERIVAATPDSLTIDAYTWGPDDAHCCATVYERWTFRLEFSVVTGSYALKLVDSKPAEPVPLRPGEKKLPTAKLNY